MPTSSRYAGWADIKVQSRTPVCPRKHGDVGHGQLFLAPVQGVPVTESDNWLVRAVAPTTLRTIPKQLTAKEPGMAGRVLNRRELRKQNDAADGAAPVEGKAAEIAAPAKKRKAKTPATPKVRKPRKKKEPVRLRAHWGVFDAGMKRLALFDYNQRAAADEKVADLKAKKNGVFFLQIVKEPMPEPEPAEGPPA